MIVLIVDTHNIYKATTRNMGGGLLDYAKYLERCPVAPDLKIAFVTKYKGYERFAELLRGLGFTVFYKRFDTSSNVSFNVEIAVELLKQPNVQFIVGSGDADLIPVYEQMETVPAVYAPCVSPRVKEVCPVHRVERDCLVQSSASA